MKTLISVIHPSTLEEGKKYLVRTHGYTSHEVRCIPVMFIGYCPCPAVVLVCDEAGKRWCCSREDIFTYEVTQVDHFDRSLAADEIKVYSATQH